MSMEENELGVLEIRDDSATRIAIAAVKLAQDAYWHSNSDFDVPAAALKFAKLIREVETEISR